jgi:hypothetical protein
MHNPTEGPTTEEIPRFKKDDKDLNAQDVSMLDVAASVYWTGFEIEICCHAAAFASTLMWGCLDSQSRSQFVGGGTSIPLLIG